MQMSERYNIMSKERSSYETTEREMPQYMNVIVGYLAN